MTLYGRPPNNTHGGLLSEAYLHGVNHIAEGVRLMPPKPLGRTRTDIRSQSRGVGRLP